MKIVFHDYVPLSCATFFSQNLANHYFGDCIGYCSRIEVVVDLEIELHVAAAFVHHACSASSPRNFYAIDAV